MKLSWQEQRLNDFYQQFKVRTPKRWKECAKCKDYFKDEQMYRRKVMLYCGPWYRWYCIDCYSEVERNELEEIGVEEKV